MVAVSTLLIRIPVPGGGYFNFGDVVIVFCGLYGGSRAGMVAGGIGSAIEISSDFRYSLRLRWSQGSSGLLRGRGKASSGFLRNAWPILGGILMVAIYFLGTWYMPSFGKAAAVADFPPNILQATLGFIGGRLLFAAYTRIQNLHKS